MVGPFRTSTIDCHSLCIGYVTVTDEVPLFQAISEVPTTPVESFSDAVSQRDRGCVLTSWPARMVSCSLWTSFHAAHRPTRQRRIVVAERKSVSDVYLHTRRGSPELRPAHGNILHLSILL